MVGDNRDSEASATAVETALEAGGGVKETVELETATKRALAPSWLNAAFMQEALRRGGHADALVDDIEISYAIPPGNNYCSIIFRVKVNLHGRAQPTFLLVKGIPTDGQWAAMVKESRFFTKEIIVFSRVLPAMEALLSEVAPGRFPPIAARCLHHGEHSSTFIVLQDLRTQGFRMGDRRKGMDLPHALLALRTLGRFHAASAALWRRRPEIFQGLVSPWAEEGATKEIESSKQSIVNLGNNVSKWMDLPGGYGKKICGVSDTLFEKLRTIDRERPGKFNVLVHGDFWLNNMLFQYEEDTVSDIKFLDFQMSHVGNPAIDLILFKYTSLEEEVLDNHWDFLLEAYCSALIETQRALGEEVVTLQDIRNDLEEAGVYSFVVAFLWLPLIRGDGVHDVEKAAENNDWHGDAHESPEFRYWMKKLLPEFDQKGLFEEETIEKGE